MLTMSATQSDLLRALSEDGVEPLYWARVEHEALMCLVVGATSVLGRTLTITGDSTGATAYSGFAATASTEEAARAIVDVLGDRSFYRGNLVYVRAALDDTTITASGTMISSSDAVVNYTTERYSDFVSGETDIEGASASIVAVSAMGQEKDSWTKRTAKTQRTLHLRADAAVERMFLQNVVWRRDVTILRGLPGWAVADWIPSGRYAVVDGPFPSDVSSTVDDEAADIVPAYKLVLQERMEAILRDAELVAAEGNVFLLETRNPLEALEYLFELAVWLGSAVPAAGSDWVDSATFDPSSVDWSEIGHWAVSKLTFQSNLAAWSTYYGTSTPEEIEYKSGFNKPTRVSSLIEELQIILPGQVLAEEDGKIRARRIDYSAIISGSATVTDWTEEFEPDALKELQVDLVNEIIVDLGADLGGNQDFWGGTWVERDDQSQRAHRPPSEDGTVSGSRSGGRSSDKSIRLGLGGKSYLVHVSPDTTGGVSPEIAAMTPTSTAFRVFNSGPFAFAGGRTDRFTTPPGPATIPSWATLSGSRVALFRLESPAGGTAYYAASGGTFPQHVEYIECKAAAVVAGADQWFGTPDAPYMEAVEYTVGSRAVLGTTSPDEWRPMTKITDCTIARALTAEYLDRWGWGFPKISGRTRLGQMHMQIGDFVQISLPQIIGLGGKGTSALRLVFEIAGKEERYGAMHWVLALAARSTPYIAIRTHTPPTFTVGDGGPPE